MECDIAAQLQFHTGGCDHLPTDRQARQKGWLDLRWVFANQTVKAVVVNLRSDIGVILARIKILQQVGDANSHFLSLRQGGQ